MREWLIEQSLSNKFSDENENLCILIWDLHIIACISTSGISQCEFPHVEKCISACGFTQGAVYFGKF